MAIYRFSPQNQISKKQGGTERAGKKLKKLRSVKATNLDKLRLSMRRAKLRFSKREIALFDDVAETSRSTSTGLSEPFPHYMMATSSSNARKGSFHARADTSDSSSASSSNTRKSKTGLSGQKPNFNKVSVTHCSEVADDAPVEHGSVENLKRISSIKRFRRMFSSKSRRASTKYGTRNAADSASLHNSASHFNARSQSEEVSGLLQTGVPDNQDSIIRAEAKSKTRLEKSRSLKLTKLRSLRSLRTRPKWRFDQASLVIFGNEELKETPSQAEMSAAPPNYMTVTRSNGGRQKPVKTSIRASGWKPSRILSKMPSIRSRRIAVKKHSEVAQIQCIDVDRATCSSTLKSCKCPDHVGLHSEGYEFDGTSTVHLCPYRYCSLNGHHHVPSPPLNVFLTAKRQLLRTQRKNQLENATDFRLMSKNNDSSPIMLVEEDHAAPEMAKARTAATEVDDENRVFSIETFEPRNESLVSSSYSALDGYWKEENTKATCKENSNLGALLDASSEFSDENILQEFEGRTISNSKLKGVMDDPKLSFSDLWPHDSAIQATEVSIPTRRMLPDDCEETTTDIMVSSTSTGEVLEEPTITNEGTVKVPLESSIGNSEFLTTAGAATDILSDGRKYAKMWHLIYQHVLSTKEAMPEKQQVTGVHEEQHSDAITDAAVNEALDSQIKHKKTEKAEEDNLGRKFEKLELNQSDAMKLVQAAVDEILSLHEPLSPEQSVSASIIPEHAMIHDDSGKLCVTTATGFNENKLSEGDKLVDDLMSLAPKEMQHRTESTSAPEQVKAEPSEEKQVKKQRSMGFSKLKMMIVSTRFIKAMEKLRKISPREPQYLSTDKNSEAETVHLKHANMDGRRTADEWMLDYALRQVIAKLAPAQQRKVVTLIEAFERVMPEMNVNFCPIRTKSADCIGSATTTNEEVDKLTAPDAASNTISERPDNKVSSLGRDAPADCTQLQDHEIIPSNLHTELNEVVGILNLHIHNQGSPKGCPVCNPLEILTKHREVKDSKLKFEPIQQSTPAEDPDNCKAIMEKGIYSDKQKYTSIWQLIYQHVKSGITEEVGSQFNLKVAKEDQTNQGHMSVEGHIEPNVECLDFGSERLELTQNDAIELVQEAIDGLLHNECRSSEHQSSPRVINLEQKLSGKNQSCDKRPRISTLTSSSNTSFEAKDESPGDNFLIDPANEWFSTHATTSLEEKERAKLRCTVPRAYSKLKKAILCSKFVKAVEKMQKIYRQKQKYWPVEPDPEAENVHLRHCLADERKNGEVWMLDYALQQVISKLDPVMQRKVGLLIKAFETVSPGIEETGKVFCHVKTEQAQLNSSAVNLDRKQDQICESYLDYCESYGAFKQKLEHESIADSREASQNGALDEIHVVRNSSSATATDMTSETMNTSLKYYKEPTSTNSLASVSVTLEEITPAHKDNDEDSGQANGFVQESTEANDVEDDRSASAEPENLGDDCSTAAQSEDSEHYYVGSFKMFNTGSSQNEHFEDQYLTSAQSKDIKDEGADVSDKVFMGTTRHARMWNLIYQCIRSGITEKLETEMSDETDASRLIDDAKIVPERNGSWQSSLEADPDEGAEIQTSDSTSIELLQKDAIMLVQEAVDEMLLIQEQHNDRSITDGTTSDEEGFNKKDNDGRGSNIPDSIAALQEETMGLKVGNRTYQELPKTYSKFSKVIMCQKFIKKMEALRKFNQQGSQHISQECYPESERIHLRPQTLDGRKGYEDWMLDYALQQVIGKLAPAKKKRVALLVEAFETVSPQPQTETRH